MLLIWRKRRLLFMTWKILCRVLVTDGLIGNTMKGLLSQKTCKGKFLIIGVITGLIKPILPNSVFIIVNNCQYFQIS